MTWVKNIYLVKVAVGAIAWFVLGNYQSPLQAQQIVPDNTLGDESSQINGISPQEQQIEGGAVRDTNLFHSFSEFNIGENQIVNFVNPANIENIFSRVTGNNISNILGNLGVLGNANLFLINPNGISFGESASLNVNGSFIGTTATSINFTDGNTFATNPASGQALLTINQPNALQFGNQPGRIINRAQLSDQTNPDIQLNSFFNPAGLFVPANQTLGLIGGEIIAEGGNFTAIGGRIELGSVGADSTVGLAIEPFGITFDFQAVSEFNDITLTSRPGVITLPAFDENLEPLLDENNQPILNSLELDLFSFIDAASSENSSGSINIQGRNLNVLNGSGIQTFTETDFAGGNIIVNAQENINLGGVATTVGTDFVISSFIASSTLGGGNAGNIQITTSNLSIQDEAGIASNSSSTFNFITGEETPATGNAGAINIFASDSISLSSGGINSDSVGEGQAGQLNLQTDNLTLSDNASIDVSASGTGLAGDINVIANSATIDSGSSITAATTQSDGGNINLQVAENLELRDQGSISTSVGGEGNGGNINIVSQFVVTSPQDNSDITANAEFGQGGNITIETSGLFGIEFQDRLTDLSDITVSSSFGADGSFNLVDFEIQPQENDATSNVVFTDLDTKFTTEHCYANRYNSYLQTGRGGLPLASQRSSLSEYTWEDWRLIDETSTSASSVRKQTPELNKTAENKVAAQGGTTTVSQKSIQGWLVNQRGEIILTAEPIEVTPHPPSQSIPGC